MGLVETKLHMCPIMDTKTSNPTNLNAIFCVFHFQQGYVDGHDLKLDSVGEYFYTTIVLRLELITLYVVYIS